MHPTDWTPCERPSEWICRKHLALLPQTSEQRWQLPAPIQIDPHLRGSGLADPLLAVLQRRGYGTTAAIEALLEPPEAPDPRRHFPDLGKAVQRLKQACKQNERLAICGDYDADGMTSTALLVGVLQQLGASPGDQLGEAV